MEGVIAGVINTVFHSRTEEKKEDKLLSELDAVRQSLETVSSRFNNTDDPDMVESCIYEMQALTSRYRSLLREVRVQNLSRPKCINLKRASV